MRTRAFFLAALTPGQRIAFVVDAQERLQEQRKVIEAEHKRYRDQGEVFSALATEGALYVVRARIAWMAGLQRHLAKL